MTSSSSSSSPLKTEDFVKLTLSISSQEDLEKLRTDAVETENLYRELFARQRDSWEIPEVDDPYLSLVNVFPSSSSGGGSAKSTKNNDGIFKCLPRYETDDTPRAFDLGEKRKPAGADATVPSKSEFDLSWDCLTEGLLRFMNWDNVVAAGGAVAGCLSPLPDDISSGGPSATRVKRRKYFHDKFLPGSDIDLFLHGLSETEAEAKLIEIYDAVQAANPYEIRAFRSAHAVTLVSQYPFRHVQVVLRLYNSPAEVLMGFDVDACAVGFDGSRVLACPRAVLAMVTQSNTVDMTRRSPSYEMRLAKYAQRGYEIVVPNLDRSRVDPFLYEKRFDQAQGLARLLLLEKLRTPEERLRFRIEGQLKRGAGRGGGGNNWRLQAKLHKMMRDRRNLERQEGTEGVIPPSGVESSDYSTVFLPWGPGWTAERIEKQTRKKDKILNKVEFAPDGRVVKNRRPYKIHLCAVGTMEEVIVNPFPDDPPIPDDVPAESLESCVRGRLSWLVDNPGRQQIGSFHPITDGDWTEGAYISQATEELIAAALANDDEKITSIFASCSSDEEVKTLLRARDFLGRSPLHAVAIGCAANACRVLLGHPAADAELLQGRLVDGRTALHLSAMRGDEDVMKIILKKRHELATAAAAAAANSERKSDDCDAGEGAITAAAVEIFDIDGADWEVKLNPLQYAVAFGHVNAVCLLLKNNASARKVAVHKDRNESLSLLSLLAFHASESGDEVDMDKIQQILEALFDAGASTTQINTSGWTCWHELAGHPSMCAVLELFLKHDALRNGGNARALDVLDSQLCTPLFVATASGNARAVKALLGAGAKACFDEDDWSARMRQIQGAPGQGRIRQHAFVPRHVGVASQEMLRCSVALAAQNADWPCLEAFVSHSPSLANVVVWVPVNNFGGHRHAYGAQQGDTKEAMKPLDLLEKVRLQATGAGSDQASHSRNMKQSMDLRVQEARNRTNQAKIERENRTKGTYEHFLWSLVVFREEQALEEIKLQAKTAELSEEDEKVEAEAIQQIDKCCQIIRDAGGERYPRDTTGAASTNKVLAPQMLPSSGARGGSILQDPLQKFSEMPPLDFSSALSMSLHNTAIFWRGAQWKQFTSLPTSFQPKALRLMDAVCKGDVDVIESVAAGVQMCISDCVGSTPLFVAVSAGNIGSLTAVCNAAESQFELHLKEIEAIRAAGDPGTAGGGDEKGENENVIKDQIRRLNNLDIAAGEMPQSMVTPDQMRLRLEAAEFVAGQQESSTVSAGPVSSPVSLAALMLHRSIVLRSSEPKLMDLWNRLTQEQPGIFSSEVTNPIRLRPIELAIIRADIDMVRALLDTAASMGTKLEKLSRNNKTGASEKNEEEERDLSDGEDDSHGLYEEDGDYCGDDGDYCGQQSQETGVASLTYVQLRYLLSGEGSHNPDLGGMSLLQLAAATDDLSIFCIVARFAAEYGLPRGAVAAWKTEVEEKEETDEAQRLKRQQETKEIAGVNPSSHYNRLPPWRPGVGNIQNHSEQTPAAVYPTFLQFTLSVGARNLSRALMSGDADDALLGWIMLPNANMPESVSPKKGTATHRYSACDGAALAGRWLIQHISGAEVTRAYLAMKLVRPTAMDGIGRTALFYAPSDAINKVIDSAVAVMSEASSAGVPVEDARASFLEKSTSWGSVTALMAASSAGEIARVRALCEAGCNRSKPRGPKKWGPLHLAIPQKRANNHNAMSSASADAETKRWERAREIIQLILEGASDLELEESLLCPEAEHTPLMLAADRGADGLTTSLLAKWTAKYAASGLGKRDSELNSAMHLAVCAALGNKGPNMAVDHSFSKSLESVSALLELNDAPAVIGPGAENASGTTPVELAIEAMASVWGNGVASKAMRVHNHQQGRSKRGKGVLPPVPASMVVGDNSVGAKPSVVRRALSILVCTNSIQRTPVSLNEVQEAKKKATERAKKSSTTNHAYLSMHPQGGNGGSEYQSEPNGPPAVLGSGGMASVGLRSNQWPSLY